MPAKRCSSLARVVVFITLTIFSGTLAARAGGDAPEQGVSNHHNVQPTFDIHAVNASAATARVVAAANAFLATLDEKQRAKVLFPFNDDKQRARWSNFPAGFVPRGGVSFRELNEAQRSAGMALVASALSRRALKRSSRSCKPTKS